MISYKELKEDNELLKEVNARNKEVLNKITELLRKRNEEIAMLKVENRYMQRKINEYENYLDKNKELLAKYNSK